MVTTEYIYKFLNGWLTFKTSPPMAIDFDDNKVYFKEAVESIATAFDILENVAEGYFTDWLIDTIHPKPSMDAIEYARCHFLLNAYRNTEKPKSWAEYMLGGGENMVYDADLLIAFGGVEPEVQQVDVIDRVDADVRALVEGEWND